MGNSGYLGLFMMGIGKLFAALGRVRDIGWLAGLFDVAYCVGRGFADVPYC